MCKNILDRDVSIENKKMEGRSLFSRKILEVRICYAKSLKSRSNVINDFPEVKTSESSKQFCRDSNYIITDCLPC